jgi:hypothetical protein
VAYAVARTSSGLPIVGLLGEGGVGELAALLGAGLGCALAAVLLTRAAARLPASHLRRGLPALVAVACIATLSSTAPRMPLQGEGVSYTGSWLTDLGPAPWLAVGAVLLALAAFANEARPRPHVVA